MAKEISEQIIEDMANLAQLDIAEKDIPVMRQEMQDMMEFIDKINQQNNLFIQETMPHQKDMKDDLRIDNGTKMSELREDVVTNKNQKSELLANAPEVCSQGVVVPRSI